MTIHTNRRLTGMIARVLLLGFGLGFCFMPTEGQARPPSAHERQWVIQTMESDARRMRLRCGKGTEPWELVWVRQTRLLNNWKLTDTASPKSGQAVVLYYHCLFSGRRFATKIVGLNG